MIIKKTAKFISIAALFLVPIFPLIVANSYFFPFITGKAFYFRILVELAFFAWLILASIDKQYRPKWSPLTIGVSLFALIALVADILGVNPLRSIWSNFERMEGWLTIIHLWAFYITASGMFGTGENGKRMWHRWIVTELLVAAIVGVYGILQLFHVLDIHQGSTRIDASLGNAAYMAVYMLWNAGMAAYMFCVARAKQIANSEFLQWAFPILAVVFSYEVFETATRGTIIGLVLGVIGASLCYVLFARGVNYKKIVCVAVFLILELVVNVFYPTVLIEIGLLVVFLALLGFYVAFDNKKGVEPKTARFRWVNFGLITAIFVIIVGFYLVKDASFVQNSEVLSRMANVSWSEAKGQARNYIWPIALKGAIERPILGYGQENFSYIFNANYNPKMWNQEQWFDRAHSVFIDWLVASGLIGLIAYLSLYVLFLVMVWKSTSRTLAEKAILTGVLAGYAIHNVFVFDNLASYVMFFMALGFVNSFKDFDVRRIFGEREMGKDAFSYVVAPVLIILLVVTFYYVDAKPIQANTRLIYALSNCASTTAPDVSTFEAALQSTTYVGKQEIREQLMPCADRVIQNENMPGATKQAFYNFSGKEIQAQLDEDKWADARIYTLAGSFYTGASQFTAAFPYLERAAQLSPGKQSIDVEYATALINLKQVDKAVEILKRDYDAAPENPYVKSVYALALVVQGNEAMARKMFGGDPSIFENYQMVQAYILGRQPLKAIALLKKLLEKSPNDINMSVKLAQLLYENGMKADAIAVFRNLQKAYPQYKDAIEAAIKEVNSKP